MNVAQYKPSNTMTAQALESISHFASIGNVVEAAGVSSSAADAGDENAAYANAAEREIDGISYTFDFAPDGACRIAKCESDVAEIRIPSRVDEHPVTVIGSHAFCTCYSLERVHVPDTVVEIGEYAFMNTSLDEFNCPSGLHRIGKNAFYKCSQLARICLNGTLAYLGESAFRETALASLDVPASVGFIGQDAFKGTRLTFAGESPSLRIAPDNPRYGLLDDALYCAREDGLSLVQALDEHAEDFTGPENLVIVEDRAFAGLKELRHVTLPEGVDLVGDEAFKGCTSLTGVELPDSVRLIGQHAFWGTALRTLRIPASLEHVGTAAFYTGGSIARNFKRTIERIDIAPANGRFYLHDDILCQRRDGAGDIALIYIGSSARITIPRNVTAIGPYAFLKAANVTELHIHDGIEAIDVGGFDFGHAVTSVVYDAHDDGGASRRYVISYPPGQAGRQATRQTFARGYFNLAYAYASADNAVLITQDTLVRSKAMLERLANPVMLDKHMAAEFVRKLERTLTATVVAFGKGGFPQGIDLLFDRGMLNQDTIDEAIQAASEAGEIAVLSRLMELKRTAFASPMFDFDL